jgi:glyoxylase-like metal-dependent hydrolase (beta-lactamase superfamily II)
LRVTFAHVARITRKENALPIKPAAAVPAAACALLLAAAATAQQAPGAPRGPAREIINVTGDLYRARNGNWYTIFLATPEGIILGDPINDDFAQWLKTELDARFDVPVRYVVYSHSHFDHAAGGRAFADRRSSSRTRTWRVTWTAGTRKCRATWSTATRTAASTSRTS